MDMFHLLKGDDNNNLVEQNSKIEIQNKINDLKHNMVGHRDKKNQTENVTETRGGIKKKVSIYFLETRILCLHQIGCNLIFFPVERTLRSTTSIALKKRL